VLTEIDVRERAPSDPTLACPIDNKLFRDAIKTPCCGTVYCEDCIQTHLLEHDFVCPNCGQKIPSLDKLAKDSEARQRVAAYIEKTIEASRNQPEDAPEGAAQAIGTVRNTVMIDQVRTWRSIQLLSVAGSAADDGISAQLATEGQLAEVDEMGNPEENMPQIIADSVPQLQAQLQQLAMMLQNPSLPKQVRAQTEVQHQQLQFQLQHAQTIAAALAMQTITGTVGGGFAAQGQLQPGVGPNVFPNGVPLQGGILPGMNFNTTGGWNAQFAGQDAAQDSPYQRLPVNNRRRNLKRERPSDFVEVAGVDGGAKQPRFWEWIDVCYFILRLLGKIDHVMSI
jgi:protein MPE1